MILIEKQLHDLFRECGADPDEIRALTELTLSEEHTTHSYKSNHTYPFSFVMETYQDRSHVMYIKSVDDDWISVLKFRNKIKDKDLYNTLDKIREERLLTAPITTSAVSV